MSSLPNTSPFVLSKNVTKGGCALTLVGTMLLPLSPALAAPQVAAPAPRATQQDSIPATPAEQPGPVLATQAVQQAPTPTVQAVRQSPEQGTQSLQVTSGTFDILKGGTVTLKGSGFSQDFVHNKSFRLYVVPKGESVAFPPHRPRDYPYYVQDISSTDFAADGTVTVTASIGANFLEANSSGFEVVLGYRDGHEDGWIPAGEVRTELKVADVPALSSPTLSYNESTVDSSADSSVTVNGAGFQNISYNGSEALILALRAVDPSTGEPTGPALAQTEAKFTAYSTFFGQYMGFTNGRFSSTLKVPAGTLKADHSYVVQAFEHAVPEDHAQANSQALSTQEFVPVTGVEQPKSDPSVTLSTNTVDMGSSTTVKVKGKNFKIPEDSSVDVLFSAAEADGSPTGKELERIVLPSEKISTGDFNANVNVDGTKLDPNNRYAIFVNVVSSDGQAERFTAEYLNLTGKSPNDKVRERFADVPADHANHKAVLWADDQKLIDPREKDWFGVNGNATRGDLTVALYRMAGSPKVDQPATSPFSDVKTDDPNYAAYLWAREKGITFGWADGKFHAEAGVSKATVAAFLYRFDGKKGITVTSAPYTDVKVGSAFYREIAWTKQQKLQNSSSNQYHPSALTSRGEMAEFLMNYKVH